MTGNKGIWWSTMTLRYRIAASMGALLIGCSAVVLSACHHGGGQSERPQTPTLSADSLIVAVDDVRQIAGVAGLNPDPQGDEDKPDNTSAAASHPCPALSVQQVAFGDTWKQFRGVSYTAQTGHGPHTAKSLSLVDQAVGVYADATAAQEAFDKLVPQLDACSGVHTKHLTFTVTRPEPSTVIVTYTGHFESASIYAVKSQYLLLVSAVGVPRAGQTAHDVLQKITARIG
jgi:hypothetical protein